MEINAEAPANIANMITDKLKACMVKAGEVFCTRCHLDADISWAHELDSEGNEVLDSYGNPIVLKGILPTYWIH